MSDLSNEEYRRLAEENDERTREIDNSNDALYRTSDSPGGICGNMTTLTLGIFFATVLIFLLIIFIAGPLIQRAARKAPGECIQCPAGKPGPPGEDGNPGGPG